MHVPYGHILQTVTEREPLGARPVSLVEAVEQATLTLQRPGC